MPNAKPPSQRGHAGRVVHARFVEVENVLAATDEAIYQVK
jgi:hypothetical protein